MSNIKVLLSASVPAFLVLSSCGGTPSFGEKIKAEGAEVAKIGENWEKGNSMIKKGEAMRKKGKKAIREGEELIEKGQKLKRDSESAYGVRKAGA